MSAVQYFLYFYPEGSDMDKQYCIEIKDVPDQLFLDAGYFRKLFQVRYPARYLAPARLPDIARYSARYLTSNSILLIELGS